MEGDSILRTARRMEAALAGGPVSVRTPGPRRPEGLAPESINGLVLERVESRGKHLLLHFAQDLLLHSHLGMHGGWHLYRAGQRWRRPASQAWIALAAEGSEAVNFRGIFMRIGRRGRLLRDPRLVRLGPDILAEDFEPGAAIARMRGTNQGIELGEALLGARGRVALGHAGELRARVRARRRTAERPVDGPLGEQAQDARRAVAAGRDRRELRALVDERRVQVAGAEVGVVEQLAERLRSTDTLMVADYRGLTMPQIDELRSRHPDLDENLISDVILGVVSPVGDQGGDIARTAALVAKLPETTGGGLPNGPPPAHRWAERDPAAAARLAAARAAITALAEENRLPVENLLSPDALRRLSWDPPKPCDGQAVADALAGYGARPWQVELTAEPIAQALCDLPAPVDEAAILDDVAQSEG